VRSAAVNAVITAPRRGFGDFEPSAAYFKVA